MTILNANGQPVAVTRKVALVVDIIDQQPGAAMAERSRMSFDLDTNDPHQIAVLLQTINQSVIRRLQEIGFMGFEPGRVVDDAETEDEQDETVST